MTPRWLVSACLELHRWIDPARLRALLVHPPERSAPAAGARRRLLIDVSTIVRAWMRSLAILADGAVCTTAAVAEELRVWLGTHFGASTDGISIGRFQLGSDIAASSPSRGSGNAERMAALRARLNILMVGTL